MVDVEDRYYHEETAGRIFSIIHWQARIYFNKKLKSCGLSWGELHMLLMLYKRGDSMTQSEITKRLRVDKATTSRIIRKLEEDGYVVRKKDEKDSRIYRTYPTEKMKNIEQEVKKVKGEWEEILFKNFTKEERNFIIGALKKMAQNAREANKEDE
ncbi:MAG: MarR family winged helix-turn-helix transcriptional regulator [Candidatus Methanofastidiosia archaeon]